MDLVALDESRVGTVYFIMSEENVEKKIALPWVSFCSDAGAPAAEGVFLQSNPHPRAYGSFARLLGKYVREEEVISLGEAVRRLSAFRRRTWGSAREAGWSRGTLPMWWCSIPPPSPTTPPSRNPTSTPRVYTRFVNGTQVVKDGEHTGAKPGRVVRGPGWAGWD